VDAIRSAEVRAGVGPARQPTNHHVPLTLQKRGSSWLAVAGDRRKEVARGVAHGRRLVLRRRGRTWEFGRGSPELAAETMPATIETIYLVPDSDVGSAWGKRAAGSRWPRIRLARVEDGVQRFDGHRRPVRRTADRSSPGRGACTWRSVPPQPLTRVTERTRSDLSFPFGRPAVPVVPLGRAQTRFFVAVGTLPGAARWATGAREKRQGRGFGRPTARRNRERLPPCADAAVTPGPDQISSPALMAGSLGHGCWNREATPGGYY